MPSTSCGESVMQTVTGTTSGANGKLVMPRGFDVVEVAGLNVMVPVIPGPGRFGFPGVLGHACCGVVLVELSEVASTQISHTQGGPSGALAKALSVPYVGVQVSSAGLAPPVGGGPPPATTFVKLTAFKRLALATGGLTLNAVVMMLFRPVI